MASIDFENLICRSRDWSFSSDGRAKGCARRGCNAAQLPSPETPEQDQWQDTWPKHTRPHRGSAIILPGGLSSSRVRNSGRLFFSSDTSLSHRASVQVVAASANTYRERGRHYHPENVEVKRILGEGCYGQASRSSPGCSSSVAPHQSRHALLNYQLPEGKLRLIQMARPLSDIIHHAGVRGRVVGRGQGGVASF